MFNSPTKIVWIFVLLFLLGMIFFISRKNFFTNSEKNVSSGILDGRVDFAQERLFWSDQMDKIGGFSAYKDFLDTYKDFDYLTQHGGAHILGGLLYKETGIEGIKICDDSYIFGCYHGFMGEMVSFEGTSTIIQVDRACREKEGFAAGNCYHGVGHGLLGYFGRNQINKALEVCKTLSLKKNTGGCFGGVFMEYNLANLHNLMISEKDVREMTNNNLYHPCDVVAIEFRPACYYEQSDWWMRVLGKKFKMFSDLCQSVSVEYEREMCFVGIGRTVAPISNYVPEVIIDNCDGLTPSVKAMGFCRVGAALRYHEYSLDTQGAYSICSDFSPDFNCLKILQEFESQYNYENFFRKS